MFASLWFFPHTGSHCTFLDGGNFGFMEKSRRPLDDEELE